MDTNGDGKRDITGTVQGAVRTELARVMSHLAAGSVDPVALAKAIAEHIDLVAK